jgi:hypothetical protein
MGFCGQLLNIFHWAAENRYLRNNFNLILIIRSVLATPPAKTAAAAEKVCIEKIIYYM